MQNGTNDNRRAGLRRRFLEEIGWGDADPKFLAGDASNRTYYRVASARGHTAVLMDAHDPREKVFEFIQISKILSSLKYSVPEIIASDLDRRLLLLEDLGDKTFTQCLEKGTEPYDLYRAATKVLVDLHKNYKAGAEDVSFYTNEIYRRECNALLDWYYPQVMRDSVPAAARTEWAEIWNNLLTTHLTLPKTLVLRDFHVDNLVWLSRRKGIQQCGLLDFQDALIGSPAYDLVSLFEDARLDVDPQMTRDLLEYYFSQFPKLDQDQFMIEYNLLGAQRSAKIIGYFTRLAVRDKKPRYLGFIPRTWNWLTQDLTHPCLKPLKEWMDHYIPQEKRKVPDVTH